MTWLRWLMLGAAAGFAIGAVLAARCFAGPRWRHFLAHRGATVAATVVVLLVILAVAAPWLTPYAPSAPLDLVRLANRAPSWQHPLGTDQASRDVWTRLLYGARVSLGVGVLAMLVSIVAGGVVGVAAGWFPRGVDPFLMRMVDVGLAVPRILIVLLVAAIADHIGPGALILLLGLTSWFATSRLVRAEVRSVRRRSYVEAANALGAGDWRVLRQHIVPNAASPLVVAAALGVGNVILLEAALSFLGAGVQPPLASWGTMIADGRDQLTIAPWTTIFPGLAIAASVAALHVLADRFHQVLDPRRHAGAARPRELRNQGRRTVVNHPVVTEPFDLSTQLDGDGASLVIDPSTAVPIRSSLVSNTL